MILCLNGDRHDRLRRLIVPAFRVPLVDTLRPRMRQHLTAIVEAALGGADRAECDVVAAIADPYPVTVLSDLLDIPNADGPQVRRWATDLGLAFSFQAAQHLEAIESAIVRLYDIAERPIDDRRRYPGDDLVSALVAAEADGQRLDAVELRNIVVTVLFAGHDTTKHQLALALHTLAGNPPTWERLAAEPDLAPAAVEELMRVPPATPLISRIALEDVTHCDLTIPAGTRVLLLLGAANRDPDVFGDGRFDVTGLSGQQAGSSTVTFSDPGVGAFVAGSADLPGRFGLDQLLQHQLHRVTDQINAFTGAKRVQQLRQDRLRQGHRCGTPSCALAGTHRASRRWPHPAVDPCRLPPSPPLRGTLTPKKPALTAHRPSNNRVL
jgi:hypothetical protein